MLNGKHQDPYAQIKEKTFLPILLSNIVLLPLIWLSTSILIFPFISAALLLWVWMLIRVWKYQPTTEEKLAFIRIFQAACTLGFCAGVFFVIPSVFILFFPTVPLLLSLTFCGLGCLAFLGIVLAAWQGHRINKVEQSGSLGGCKHSYQEQKQRV